MINSLIFRNNLDEISTFDSYFGKIIFYNERMLIPYINLGISEHVLNPQSKMKYIDYCYTVFIDIDYLKINNNLIKDNLLDKYDPKNSIYLGGEDLIGDQNIFDIEVQAKDAFLQLNYNSEINEKHWVPIKTSNFKKNMDEVVVKHFIKNENLPKNLIFFLKT